MKFISRFLNTFKLKPEEKFWGWILENKERLEDLKTDPFELMTEISPSLKNYHKNLVVEVGCNEENELDLIISADGVKEFFPVVEKLVSSAPTLEGWNVIAFRPKSFIQSPIKYNDVEFDPLKIFVKHTKNGSINDLIIYHPSYDKSNIMLIAGGCFILLDRAIGEYNVATKIRHIDFEEMPENKGNMELIPLTKLQEIIK